MNNDKIQKLITMIKRDRNYGSDDFKGFESSLRHSLRLEQNEYDEFEIDEKLSYLNKVFYNGKTEQLTSENASIILEKILEDFKKEVEETQSTKSNEKERNLFRQTKKKLKDFSNEIDIEEVSIYINEVMENNKEYDREEYNRILTRNNQKRINQKLDLLQSFTELNEKLSGNEKVKRHTNRIKETILVIPATNEIGDPIGYGDFVRNTIIDYYNQNFPEYEIKFVVSHLDETTPHAHLFLDLKNKYTNKYDFNKKEIEFVEKFINDNKLLDLPKKPVLEDYKIPRRSEKRQKYLYDKDLKSWTASVLQTSFFQHFNASALKYEKPIYAKKLEKNKSYNERNKLIEEEAKKPKAERSHNYYQKKINDQKELINKLNNKINVKENENKALQEKNNELELKFEKIDRNYKNGLNKTSELHKEFKEKQEQIKKLEDSNKLKINEFDKTIKSKKEEIQKLENKIIDNKNDIKQKTEEFNKEVDRVYDIIEKESEQIIENVNKRLSKFESIYARISADIAEFKNSITKSMADAFNIFGKLQDITVEFNKRKGDKKNGIFNGLESLIHFGKEKNIDEANKIYQEATKSFDEDFGIGSLLIVEEVVKSNKKLQEIKEIKPAFDNTVKPAINKKLNDLEYLQSKSRTYKDDLNKIGTEIKEEMKIDRNKYKIKLKI